MPRFSGESPSLALASILTISLSYNVSSASCQACLRTNSTTFCATSSVFIFLLCLHRQLLADKFLQLIECAVPATGVTVARSFVWQSVVGQAQLRTVVSIGQFHSDDTDVVFPILIIFPLPGEHDLFARPQRAVFAAHRHSLALGVRQVPPEFSSDSHLRDEVVRLNILRTEPLFQLSRIRPSCVDTIARRFNQRLISSESFSDPLVVMILLP